MNRTQLVDLARTMRAELPATGHSARTVNATHIAITKRAPGRLTLIISRHDIYPARETADIIARAFGVAEDTHGHPTTTRIPTQDGRTMPIKSMVYSWYEDLN